MVVVDLAGRRGRPISVHYFSFSCSFGINYNRLAPPPLGLAPPLGKPGSAAEWCDLLFYAKLSINTQETVVPSLLCKTYQRYMTDSGANSFVQNLPETRDQ